MGEKAHVEVKATGDHQNMHLPKHTPTTPSPFSNFFPMGDGLYNCQGHSSLDAPSELNPPQRIPSPFKTPLVPQAEG